MSDSYQIKINYTQLLDHTGKIHTDCSESILDKDLLIAFYSMMLRTRVFDQKSIKLQRTGKLGTYASSLGQEAIGTALGKAMLSNDILVPTYRDYAAQFSRGVAMSEILLYWGGDERGMNYQKSRQDFPICVPIASQTCHATGIAYAMKLQKKPNVTVCVIGDGATSKGDFYEAMNASGVWQLPIVFLINNNQWAISLPREKQTTTKTLAQKAVAAGISAQQFDGNDVLASYQVLSQAIEETRSGTGPCVLEALSYRLSDHTTADDAGRYRSEQELKEHWQYEPISRLKTYLLSNNIITQTDLDEIQQSCDALVEQQVEVYLNTRSQQPESMFDYLYESVPTALQQQRNEVIKKGDDNV
ncbi:Branched-chain alpha-keto acid dehydrogenase, E1 component, alpha subunit [hydrothermal vent metagenome]|uniref:Branched-chain alpha-keto acid dehydrogenase, E1 component, alpha subunit n=1 Tax=hydrothermal vent metagenome TaxID=652676 RepID=A0A3B0ZXU1_9ZZZZ